jgi:hypothetical protein
MMFQTLIVALLIACAIMTAGAVFMLIRNEWVYRAQMAFHAECFDKITASEWVALGQPTPDDLCASYGEMMRRFWIWDREKFRIRRLPASRKLRRVV